MTDPTSYAVWLWLGTGLLTLRVLGQVIAVLFAPWWLPGQGEQWMSGLVPYRWLLPAQIVVLTLMAAISLDFARGYGWFVEPWPRAGRVILAFSILYGGGMVARYIIRMAVYPDQRWFGGTIPIIFHTVIAGFLALFARWHVGVG